MIKLVPTHLPFNWLCPQFSQPFRPSFLHFRLIRFSSWITVLISKKVKMENVMQFHDPCIANSLVRDLLTEWKISQYNGDISNDMIGADSFPRALQNVGYFNAFPAVPAFYAHKKSDSYLKSFFPAVSCSSLFLNLSRQKWNLSNLSTHLLPKSLHFLRTLFPRFVFNRIIVKHITITLFLKCIYLRRSNLLLTST